MQSAVLQAVVHDDDAGAARTRGLRPGETVGADDGRRDAGEQQRLVADIGRVMPRRIDQHGRALAGRAAVAAREKNRRLAHLAQQTRHGQSDGRLASAAGDEIADADHGNADARAAPAHLQRRRRAVKRAERPERASPPVRPLRAPEGRRAHQRRSISICAK